MTAIIIKQDEEPEEKIELLSGAFCIGRAMDNDLTIADATVSSHHARIFTYLGASYIEDLDSSNGTWLNGKRVQKHTLHPGDVIKVGKHILEIAQ